ncbi:MAG: response regulator, partial [Albidovulum sp.]|uniref:response regulator n=1 Tax=Albidovulum sp. TaxID=1872424 RepID=UPI003C8EA9A8
IDLSQLTEGEILFRPVTAVIRQELEQAAATKMPMRGGPEPGVEFEIADEVPEFGRFDPILLRKCLAHLCALVAGDQPTGVAPRMDLRCALAPGRRDRLRITVAGRPGTNGTSDAITSATPAGESLAQAVAHRIAEVMGGKASLMRTPDGGLVARVELPFITIPEPPATGAETIYGRLRVLVVDDISSNRLIVAQMLRSLRIEVIEADGGSDALEWLKAEAFDLVLLDMNMPDMDGEATFREIRESTADWAQIPVVALTADAVTYQRDHYMALGLNGYVTKPVDKRLLWAEILTAAPPPPPL